MRSFSEGSITKKIKLVVRFLHLGRGDSLELSLICSDEFYIPVSDELEFQVLYMI